MEQVSLPVYGLHGESHAAPMDTLVSYWAALGAGARGITAGLQMTNDGYLVCCPGNTLTQNSGSPYLVSNISWQELRNFDAGANFRSVVLDADNQPGGEQGEETPWAGGTPGKPRLSYPGFEEVLRLFGRRCQLMFLITDEVSLKHSEAIAIKAIEEITAFGLEQRVIAAASGQVCRLIKERSPYTPLAFIAQPGKSLSANVKEALEIKARYLYTTIEDVSHELHAGIDTGGLEFLLTSNTMPYAPTAAVYGELVQCKNVGALVMRSVDRTVQLGLPPALVLADDFAGTEIDRETWACGYSHANTDTTLSQDDGFIISIKEGGTYSGGAAVTLLPIVGSFDARVDFRVDNPHQATTFELACIGIDPGYHHIDNSNLDSRSVNLTFDVHGAPPYASSERDEDDGFRIGWNNGFNLARIGEDWQADSVNMFNKYGRDVGSGDKDNPTGTLRLQRNGTVFNSYYKDKYNKEWVCSGTALVGNLGSDVFLRLAAKHWTKKEKTPPANRIVFTHFRLYQP